MEYTLEDAFETLKDKKTEIEKYIEDLTNRISNNPVPVLTQTSTLEEIKTKAANLQQKLLNEIKQIQPDDYPIPRTVDLRMQVITEMEEELCNVQELYNSLKKRLSDIQEDTVDLKNEQSGFDKMRTAFLDNRDMSANTKEKYEKVYLQTKQIFQQVKNDLYTVVDTLFPDNDDFKDLLAALTSAYLRGGDDVYVDITPNVLSCVNFLLEADIITYHRHDKMKIKISEFL